MPATRFAELAEAYGTVKRRRGVVDFDDLLTHALQAMADDPTFAEVVRWRFRHFFVDEAQDLNPLQHALLEAWRDGRPDLCLVGDPRQAIYGWNGADPTTLIDVERAYPGITVVRLTSNFRCTPQVVRAGSAALGAGAGTIDDTSSARNDGAPVRVATFDDDGAEVAAVVDAVRAAGAATPWEQIAVLARTNEQLAPFEQALARAGVPVGRAAGRSALEVAIDQACRCRTHDDLANWVERVFADDDADSVRARVADEADRFLASGEPGGFRAWLDGRDPFDAASIDAHGGGSVALVTFHAAKGREWRHVFVTGVEAGLVPHASAVTPQQRAEEARLLYVALTRASDQLVVTAAARRNGSATAPSDWLDSVRASADVDSPVPPPLPRGRRSPDRLEPYRRWRADAARRACVPDAAICSDHVLTSLADDPPTTVDELARRLGITPTAAARLHALPAPAAH